MRAHYYIRGRQASTIAASVETAIRDHRLDAGDRLPTVRALAARLRVSPATVAAAYRALGARGLLTTRRRGGTRVSSRPPIVGRAAPRVPAHARNLADGNPDPALLPPLAPAIARLDLRPRVYGEARAEPMLLELAAREFERAGVPARALTVVAGALDGIERVLQAHARPGDRVAVEDPGYPGVLDLLRALGLVLEPVRVDDFGPLADDLARALRVGVRALIVTPRAQNPTGAALDEARAADLRALLRRHPEVLVVEDDHAGPVAGTPAFTLADESRAAWAVVRSVSKAFGPDLRLAVIAADVATIARVEGRLAIGPGWVSHLLQQIVAALWTDPDTEGRLRHAAETYAARRGALLAALARHGIEAHGRSGLNVWVPVREEVEVARALLEAGYAVSGGERFRLRSPAAIRIGIGRLEPGEAPAVADALARAVTPSGATRTG